MGFITDGFDPADHILNLFFRRLIFHYNNHFFFLLKIKKAMAFAAMASKSRKAMGSFALPMAVLVC